VLQQSTRQDIAQEFERGFEGMTDNPVKLDDLLQAREQLIAELVGKMPEEHRKFLASFKKGKPEWDLLGIPHVENLPAVLQAVDNDFSKIILYLDGYPLKGITPRLGDQPNELKFDLRRTDNAETKKSWNSLQNCGKPSI